MILPKIPPKRGHFYQELQKKKKKKKLFDDEG
jgi:hypothetical protein